MSPSIGWVITQMNYVFWMASIQMNVPESVTNYVAMTANEINWHTLRGQFGWNILRNILKFWKI